MPDVLIDLPILHSGQVEVLDLARRFNVIVCGRRWGKTFLGQDIACNAAIDGKLVGWFAPNYKYLMEAFKALRQILSPISRSNATEKVIELVTGGKIEFWTLDDPDAGRSRKYDEVIIDEAGLVLELSERWREAIRPTLMDRQGRAWFFGTPKPPTSLQLKDYAFYQFYQRGLTEGGEWASFHRPSNNNPHLRAEEIEAMRIEPGMTARIAKQEIDALFLSESTDAVFSMSVIEPYRKTTIPDMKSWVIAFDPATTSHEGSDESGIIVAGRGIDDHIYVVADLTGKYSPAKCARLLANASAHYHNARIIYEQNQGGDFVKHAIQMGSGGLSVKGIVSTGKKEFRANGVLGYYEIGTVHHVGEFVDLENEMVNWNPFDKKMDSPNRMDALVIAIKWLTNSYQVGTKTTRRITQAA